MPESKSRKSAAAKKKAATSRKTTERRQANAERQSRTGGAGHDSLRDRAREATATKQKPARSDDDAPSSRKRATVEESDASTKRPLSTAERRRLQRSSEDQPRRRTPVSRRWVPPTFIAVGLIGVAWLITYYIAGVSGIQIPYMMDWGNWNILIGMGLMGAAFGLATLWK